MTDRPRYTLDDDIAEAESAARALPEQIARVRAHLELAKARLSPISEDELAPEGQPPSV